MSRPDIPGRRKVKRGYNHERERREKERKKELNDEELKKTNGGVMVEAYEVLATGVAKLTSLIYRLFH